MILVIATYFAAALAGLTCLAVMILRIGAMMADCPQNGPGLRSAAVTVCTGFCAIGAGGILLIGAIVPAFGGVDMVALIIGVTISLGLVALSLGLGFTHAITILRAVAEGRRMDAAADAA